MNDTVLDSAHTPWLQGWGCMNVSWELDVEHMEKKVSGVVLDPSRQTTGRD